MTTVNQTVPGLRPFAYTLVWTQAGDPLLVADPIVNAYLAYVRSCKEAHETPTVFDAWLGVGPLRRTQQFRQ
jgi:hypothetical protein